jgi:dihydroneopterin aldolase
MTRPKIIGGFRPMKPRSSISTAPPAFSSIMSDLIRVIDLEVFTHIGVPDAERREPSACSSRWKWKPPGFPRAAAENDIGRTVDYLQVAQYIKRFAGEKPRQLLETFAEELARDLLGAFPIRRLRLEVKKFILPDAAHVSVEIERKA